MSKTDAYGLEGAHALVTGGGRGIGAAIALALGEKAARVSLLGRTEETLNGVYDRLQHKGAVAIGDVTNADMVATAIGHIEKQAGPIDILINNAGAVETSAFADTGHDLWQRMIAVNLTSVFTVTRLCISAMRKKGWGRIVNIASTAGLKGYAYVSAYCAAKHGVVGLTRALALELADSEITVNAVCPGYTDTDLLRGAAKRVAAATGLAEAGLIEQFRATNPQNRLIEPEEVAAAVIWLCSGDARGVTGQAIAVAGGEVM